MPLAPSPSSPRPLPPLVLVVEPNRDTRQLYEAAFSAEGLWVAEASGPGDALQCAAELRPDAVVTDIALGGQLEGVVLAERLRQQPGTADIPIVAVCGLEPEGLGVRQRLFAAILRKPVGLDALIRDVRSVIARAAELRKRGDRARQRIPALLERSERLRGRSQQMAAVAGDRMTIPRGCPSCGGELCWIERRTLDGIVFDYYRPCAHGCGLYCYDHTLQRFVTLIG